MPLRIVRAGSTSSLWDRCLRDFLGALDGASGPAPHAARLWVAHRTQRDAVLAAAAEAGLPGWFDPPVHFLSELGRLFGVEARPIGILTGRLLVARLAREHGDASGMLALDVEAAPARSHMLDGLFGDLLSEGVEVATLRRALAAVAGDDFTRRRNDWVIDTYAAFLEALSSEGLYDSRQIHALSAGRIESGGLPEAVRSAGQLFIYGITSLRQRRRLFRALANQEDVLVTVYLLGEPEASEWEDLTDDVVDADDQAQLPLPRVQPVPDAVREANYVARTVKRLLVETECHPRDIAIIARSGRDDTHRVYRAFTECGVPATARLRIRLSEVPALRAILDLLRAQAGQWDYRGVRSVVMTPYFGAPLDPAALDFLAARRRIGGLDRWIEEVEQLRTASREGSDERALRQMRSQGLSRKRIDDTLERLEALRDATRPMAGELTESGWIELTRELTAGRLFDFRRRLCRVVGDRHDVVRMDQRAVTVVDGLLREWATLVRGRSAFDAAEWYDRLRRLLEANELALSTPMQEGVQILEAHEAALTPFAHAFVVHANDGEFPRAVGGGGIFSERERAVLAEAGVPVEDRSLGLRRERSLWRSVTSGPSVTVTYRTATVAGVPLLPSLMVPPHDASIALPTTGTLDEREAYSPKEQRRIDIERVARSRRGGEADEVPVSDVHSVRHAVVGAFAEELRSGGLDDVPRIADLIGVRTGALFGRDWPVSERAHLYAGWLRDPVVLAALADRFGPDHVWSASQLQGYSVRPFDFLLQRVLRIEDQSEAEEDTTPLATGSVIHSVLETLYSRLLAEGGAGLSHAVDRVDAISEEVFETVEREATVWLGLPAIWTLKREHIREVIRAFVAWDEQYRRRKKSTPVAIERVFGTDGVEPILLSGSDVRGLPASFLASGRIDRVDRTEDGLARVIDYKSKNVPKQKGHDDGAVLQSALYMQAWHATTGDSLVEGVFLSVAKPGTGSRSGLSAANLDGVMQFAFSIPARVRAGLFEPVQALSSGEVKPWQPGPEITRSHLVIGAGNRFEQPTLEEEPGE